MRKDIAIFDFDDTLIEGDSMVTFMRLVKGDLGFVVAGISALIAAVLNSGGDIQTAVKREVLRRVMKDVSVEQAKQAAEKLTKKITWKKGVKAEWNRLRRSGCRMVVATGALEIYMPNLLAGMGCDVLLATRLEVKDGVYTGEMVGENCVRVGKANRITEYFTHDGPFHESWGYGNKPSDLQFLALVSHPHLVPKGKQDIGPRI